MKNPWLDLPPGSLIHAADEAGLRALGDEAGLTKELLPEPYVGRLDAPVVLLMNNPKAGENDQLIHTQQWFRAAHRDNLLQRRGQFPFYYLDPNLKERADSTVLGNTRDKDPHGWAYWERLLADVLQVLPVGQVSANLLLVQAFAYHSRRRGNGDRWRLPTSEFGAHLVRRAVDEGRVVIVMRTWMRDLFPDLRRDLATVGLWPRSHRAGTVSERNLGRDGFARVLETLRRRR